MTELEDGHFAQQRGVILTGERQRRSEELLSNRFRKYLALVDSNRATRGRWLDIGCGAGVFLEVARHAGYDIEGIELSADRREIAAASTGAPVHGQPLEALQFPSGSVSVVSMINVFSHLVSPSETLAEIRRVLADDGLLLMVTGEMTDGIAQRDMAHWNLGDHLHFLGDSTMARYANKIGLDIVHHERRWLPDELFSREWLKSQGRSRLKNLIKSAINHTPGGLAMLRAVMLRRQADSSAHTSTFLLRPT